MTDNKDNKGDDAPALLLLTNADAAIEKEKDGKKSTAPQIQKSQDAPPPKPSKPSAPKPVTPAPKKPAPPRRTRYHRKSKTQFSNGLHCEFWTRANSTVIQGTIVGDVPGFGAKYLLPAGKEDIEKNRVQIPLECIRKTKYRTRQRVQCLDVHPRKRPDDHQYWYSGEILNVDKQPDGAVKFRIKPDNSDEIVTLDSNAIRDESWKEYQLDRTSFGPTGPNFKEDALQQEQKARLVAAEQKKLAKQQVYDPAGSQNFDDILQNVLGTPKKKQIFNTAQTPDAKKSLEKKTPDAEAKKTQEKKSPDAKAKKTQGKKNKHKKKKKSKKKNPNHHKRLVVTTLPTSVRMYSKTFLNISTTTRTTTGNCFSQP